MSRAATYRMEDDRRRDMLPAIARARVALRGVEAELRSAGGTLTDMWVFQEITIFVRG